MIKTDFLVIGSGVAGLSFSLKVAAKSPDKKITIITKDALMESNTRYAQGGIAIVLNEDDSFENHIQDTLTAGDGLCDPEVVKMVVTNGPDRLRELIEFGANFDTNTDGELDLGKEGGHSANRIVHHKDVSGFEILRTLVRKAEQTPNIEILPYHYAIDLITEHHLTAIDESKSRNRTCFGAYVQNKKTGEIIKVESKVTMLASGGIGQVYADTTNPVIATGDGVALAYRAKAEIKDMEFIQFHPTALFNPKESPSFLISEAVRGFGAILRNQDGEAFMEGYHELKDLAPRDIVARAIDSEMVQSGDEFVYLDCTHLDLVKFKDHFPNIYNKCMSVGVDIKRDYIPIVPAQHYLCGGIVVDITGKTSIANLYACGECSRTGLHGANRLASNSLLEALVFADVSSDDAVKFEKSVKVPTNIPEWDSEGTVKPREKVIIRHNRKVIQKIMSDFVGIVRSDERLKIALKRLELIFKETTKLYETTVLSPQLCELRNLVNVAYLVITQSQKRKENKGGYYNIDNLEKK